MSEKRWTVRRVSSPLGRQYGEIWVRMTNGAERRVCHCPKLDDANDLAALLNAATDMVSR